MKCWVPKWGGREGKHERRARGGGRSVRPHAEGVGGAKGRMLRDGGGDCITGKKSVMDDYVVREAQ